jgi:hypothetical protein
MKNGKATSENSTAVAPFSDFAKRRASFGRNLFMIPRITNSLVEATHGCASVRLFHINKPFPPTERIHSNFIEFVAGGPKKGPCSAGP